MNTIAKKTYNILIYAKNEIKNKSKCYRTRKLAGHTDSSECMLDILDWLEQSQDNSKSKDGGFARHYHLNRGWSASYPETTGYIIPTLIMLGKRMNVADYTDRAKLAVDWLLSIQLSDGAFQGGIVDVPNVQPVAFNTGQIVLGLASAVSTFGSRYTGAMVKASDWLVEKQDSNGSWTTYKSPFGGSGLKAYDTHIAWGLFEAARITNNEKYVEAAIKNIEWALEQQNQNGWPRNCCLNDPDKPLTHTLGYYLRGIIEAYRYIGEPKYLEAAMRMVEGINGLIHADGYLPGRIGSDWSQKSSWTCLTGSVQIAACFFLLSRIFGNRSDLRKTATALNMYVVRTVKKNGPVGVRGGVSGSYPIYGNYNPYMYLNWAAKFALDAIIMEEENN